MGRFDNRKTKLTRRRRAQSKLKARIARNAEEVRKTRQGPGKGKGKGKA